MNLRRCKTTRAGQGNAKQLPVFMRYGKKVYVVRIAPIPTHGKTAAGIYLGRKRGQALMAFG